MDVLEAIAEVAPDLDVQVLTRAAAGQSTVGEVVLINRIIQQILARHPEMAEALGRG